MSLYRILNRFRHTARKPIKVTIIGAAGRIGRHLGLFLKQNNDITELALYDVVDTKGIREDLSHIDYNAQVSAYEGEADLPQAVACSHLVVLVGGASKSGEATIREDLFKSNADLVAKLMVAVSNTNKTMPFIHIVTNPINSLTAVAAEVLATHNLYDPKKLSGSSLIDLIRARTFIGELKGKDPMTITVPVVGGHSNKSTFPIISRTEPDLDISPNEAACLLKRIQFGSNEVAEAYKGEADGFMASTYSAALFCNAVIAAVMGKTAKTVAYIPCNLVSGVDYISTSFTMDASGVKEIDPLPDMTSSERSAFEKVIKDIQNSTKMANDFVKNLPKVDANKNKNKK